MANIIKTLFYIIFMLFLIYLIFELVREIIGSSLIFESLVIALLIANIGYSFFLKDAIGKLEAKFMGHIGWHKGKEQPKIY